MSKNRALVIALEMTRARISRSRFRYRFVGNFWKNFSGELCLRLRCWWPPLIVLMIAPCTVNRDAAVVAGVIKQ
jgi:hypothetical protein